MAPLHILDLCLSCHRKLNPFVRNHHLSDIAEIGGSADQFNIVLIQRCTAVRPSVAVQQDLHQIHHHPVMFVTFFEIVQIVLIDRLQIGYILQCLGQITFLPIIIRNHSQPGSQSSENILFIKRLPNKFRHIVLQRFLNIFPGRLRRHEKDRYIQSLLLHKAQNIESVDMRHGDIQQNHIQLIPPCCNILKRHIPAIGFQNLELRTENTLENNSVYLHIIYDQQPFPFLYHANFTSLS